MDYKKAFYMIIIVDFLLLSFLSLVSFKFLSHNWKKSKEVEPEILAQYNVSLNIEQLKKLTKELKKLTSP